MASYRNPYSQQGDVNMIGRSLNAILNPNSPEATRANAYVARANRYQQLADAAALDAEEQRLKNQKAMFEANRNRRLAQSTVPQIQRMFNIQEGDPTAQDLASLLIDNKGLVNALFGAELLAANERGMEARDQQNYGRAMTMAAGRTPKLNDAFSERGADMVAEREAKKQAAAYAAKAPYKIEQDNNRFNNSMKKQEDEQNFTAEQNAANRASREGIAEANRTSREGIADANRKSRENLAGQKANEPKDLTSPQMKAYEDQQFDIIDRDDDFQPVYKEFTGDDEIDQKMANYALRRMDTDFQQALDEGKPFSKALAYSRFNLTRPQMMMPVEFEVPGRFFGTNTTEIPMIVVENLKDLPEDSQRLRILDGFGFGLEEAQAIVAQLKK